MLHRSLLALLLSAVGLTLSTVSISAGERPTLNKKTCDPRPDILPHPWYEARPEYRRTYNRPRYWSGWIAHHIAPTSQEAMVWCENVQAGAYDVKNSPPRYKRYFGPKPWEVLQTAARPDFTRPTSNAAARATAPVSPTESQDTIVEEAITLEALETNERVPPPAGPEQ